MKKTLITSAVAGLVMAGLVSSNSAFAEHHGKKHPKKAGHGTHKDTGKKGDKNSCKGENSCKQEGEEKAAE